MRSLKSIFQMGRLTCGLVFVLVSGMAASTAASAQTEITLHSFAASGDGAAPLAGLIADGSGNLYGTTDGGGTYGNGTVFKLTPSGSETLLYSFTGGTDGGCPFGSLIMDASGNLYGTTVCGGTNENGTVFELLPNPSGGGYTEKVLYSFTGGTDGSYPDGALFMDTSGNLYGTTNEGGGHTTANNSFGYGVVFELSPSSLGSYTENVLYSFTGGTDGGFPNGTLLMDSSGNLYGTTGGGGTNVSTAFLGWGTVFELLPNSSGGGYTEKVLYSFTGGTDGGGPNGTLLMDTSGSLYGTTYWGGIIPAPDTSGFGTVFELSPNSSGGGYTEKVLYAFTGGTDAANPAAGLIADASGNLYGTTYFGGINYAVCGGGGVSCGTVFKVTPTGGETVLYSFTGGSDGMWPQSTLIADASGNLYGTTSNSNVDGGAVFELSGSGFVPPVHFAGTPGKDNCVGMSISTLAHTYGGTAHAAKSLGYSSVAALQNAVTAYCGGA